MRSDPDTVQGDMQYACEAATTGFNVVTAPHGVPEAEAETLRRNAGDWRLLLQVDSDSTSGMEWGDAGMLYYWIREDDLAAGRFHLVWGMHQEY